MLGAEARLGGGVMVGKCVGIEIGKIKAKAAGKAEACEAVSTGSTDDAFIFIACGN